MIAEETIQNDNKLAAKPPKIQLPRPPYRYKDEQLEYDDPIEDDNDISSSIMKQLYRILSDGHTMVFEIVVLERLESHQSNKLLERLVEHGLRMKDVDLWVENTFLRIGTQQAQVRVDIEI